MTRTPGPDDDATLTESVGVQRGAVHVSRVVVVDGADAGIDALFVEPRLTVGTAPAATVQLRDPLVSRLHCELERGDDGVVRLRDLGSKNGTWIGASRVRDADVPPGVVVRVGTTQLSIEVETRHVATPVWQGGPELGPLIGPSRAMQALFAAMARVASASATVLITGETGTGKELVARALHDTSGRRHGPFVVVDGTSLSRSLAHSELFGHARGAFTDATADRAGAFERAHGGTLFLDEVGEIPLDVQPKLLRALERREVQRLGEGRPRPVDVRVLAATHRDLPRMMNEGAFREDLLYRLLVVELRVPPLRERGADVGPLAGRFLEAAAPGNRSLRSALGTALRGMAGYGWPGNVRELRNLVERVVATGTGSVQPRTDPVAVPRVELPFNEAKRECAEAFERSYLVRLLDETGGNVSEAARRAEMNRGHLNDLLLRHGLRV